MNNEKYFRVKKEIGQRIGLDELLRVVDGDDIVLSETDIRSVSLTLEEKVRGLDGVEYVKNEVNNDLPESE